MAAVLLARRVPAVGAVGKICSVGTNVTAPVAVPAAADAIAAVEEVGLDLSRHTSRPLDAAAIDGADLVIGMAREHVREIVTLDPAARSRTFNYKDLVRRAEESPRRGEPLAVWLAGLASDRRMDELLRGSPKDDIADPIGRGLAAFRKTVAELDDLALRLVRVAWPRAV